MITILRKELNKIQKQKKYLLQSSLFTDKEKNELELIYNNCINRLKYKIYQQIKNIDVTVEIYNV